MEFIQDNFAQGTGKLNTELSEMREKMMELERQKNEIKNKYDELISEHEKVGKNFINLQDTMTKLREKLAKRKQSC